MIVFSILYWQKYYFFCIQSHHRNSSVLLLNMIHQVNFKNYQLDFMPNLDFKLNHIRVVSTWLNQFNKSKNNMNEGKKHSLALKEFQDWHLFFFLIWDYKIIDQPRFCDLIRQTQNPDHIFKTIFFYLLIWYKKKTNTCKI